MPPPTRPPSLRPLTSPPSSTTHPLTPRTPTLQHTQTRHATFIPRPHRPYTFTQLLTLSDGSTFLHRTTSPTSVYRSARDTRNTPLWNPSNEGLANVEEDEAGRLRAFRRRFGRGWDLGGAGKEGEGEKERLGAGIGGPVDEEVPGSLRSRKGVRREEEVKSALGGEGGVEQTPSQPTSAPLKQEQPRGETTSSTWSSPAPAAAPPPTSSNVAAAGIPEEEQEEAEDENLMDLISSYGREEGKQGKKGKDSKGKGEGGVVKGSATGKRK
ncbi:MAG: hypothetical protein M1831_006440 [Alyxoria varia]|nr:MAG: hypothetical protein M1831_006440 [Alyxoria varia]